jgi:hypothetical protein
MILTITRFDHFSHLLFDHKTKLEVAILGACALHNLGSMSAVNGACGKRNLGTGALLET